MRPESIGSPAERGERSERIDEAEEEAREPETSAEEPAPMTSGMKVCRTLRFEAGRVEPNGSYSASASLSLSDSPVDLRLLITGCEWRRREELGAEKTSVRGGIDRGDAVNEVPTDDAPVLRPALTAL